MQAAGHDIRDRLDQLLGVTWHGPPPGIESELMTESRAHAERQFQEEVGPLGRAKVNLSKSGKKIYQVKCHEHRGGGPGGSTYRSGHGNGFQEAIYRWVLHLHWGHPDTDAPCMKYLDEARAERAVRKTQAEEDQAVAIGWS